MPDDSRNGRILTPKITNVLIYRFSNRKNGLSVDPFSLPSTSGDDMLLHFCAKCTFMDDTRIFFSPLFYSLAPPTPFIPGPKPLADKQENVFALGHSFDYLWLTNVGTKNVVHQFNTAQYMYRIYYIYLS